MIRIARDSVFCGDVQKTFDGFDDDPRVEANGQFVYAIQPIISPLAAIGKKVVKIGRTDDLLRRLRQLQGAHVSPLVLRGAITWWTEKETQALFENYRIKIAGGEWFVVGERLESFIRGTMCGVTAIPVPVECVQYTESAIAALESLVSAFNQDKMLDLRSLCWDMQRNAGFIESLYDEDVFGDIGTLPDRSLTKMGVGLDIISAIHEAVRLT